MGDPVTNMMGPISFSMFIPWGTANPIWHDIISVLFSTREIFSFPFPFLRRIALEIADRQTWWFFLVPFFFFWFSWLPFFFFFGSSFTLLHYSCRLWSLFLFFCLTVHLSFFSDSKSLVGLRLRLFAGKLFPFEKWIPGKVNS